MSKAWSISFGDHKSTGGSSQALWAYVGIYLGLSLLICLLFVIKFLPVLIVSIKASRKLFEHFTNAVFHAPLHLLDTVPTGRILNQFTADFNVIDESMADGLGFFLHRFCRWLRYSVQVPSYRHSPSSSQVSYSESVCTWQDFTYLEHGTSNGSSRRPEVPYLSS